MYVCTIWVCKYYNWYMLTYWFDCDINLFKPLLLYFWHNPTSMNCLYMHTSNFLTYAPSFHIYDILFSMWMEKNKRGSYSYVSQSLSPPKVYVIPLLYHPFCISPGSQQVWLYNRHPCWLYVGTVYSACVSQSVEWKDADFIHTVQGLP